MERNTLKTIYTTPEVYYDEIRISGRVYWYLTNCQNVISGQPYQSKIYPAKNYALVDAARIFLNDIINNAPEQDLTNINLI